MAEIGQGQSAEVIDITVARIGDNSKAADREYIQIRRQIWARALPPQVKIIALAVIEHMWAGNLSCYPSKSRLMKMVNMTERAFDAHFKAAKALFIIEPRPGKSSVFRARIERVTEELMAMFPPALSAGAPPAESAPPPPEDNTGGAESTPRNICGSPPATSAGRRDKEEIKYSHTDALADARRSFCGKAIELDENEFVEWQGYYRKLDLSAELPATDAHVMEVFNGSFMTATRDNRRLKAHQYLAKRNREVPDRIAGEQKTGRPPPRSEAREWHEKQDAARAFLLRKEPVNG
jgi:hypothetical protein